MGSGASVITPINSFITQDKGWKEPPLDPSSDEQPVYLLDIKNPEYQARYEAWLDLSLLYEGGSALKARCERLLKKRPREDEEIYAARMDRFTYENVCGTALGYYGAAMFEDPPEFFFNGKPGDEQYTKFLSDCDGLGTTYVDFWKRCFQIMLCYGAGWILTDVQVLQDGEEPPKTLEDERRRGLRDPHLALYTPLNVINWQFDERGKMKWAVVKTEETEQDFLEKPEIVSTWYYYDRETFRVYEDRRSPEEQIRVATDDTGRTAKLLRKGRHALADVKKLPLRRVMLSEGLWLANRAYLLLVDHLNQDNTLAWSLFMSNLAMPIIIGDVDPGSMTSSETGYYIFPAGTEYKWSEPDGRSFIHSAKRVEYLREECFRSMSLQAQGRSMKATPAMQSGRSKILENSPAKQTLSGMGGDVRRHMQDVLCDVKDARHEPKIEPDVRGFQFQDDMSTEEVFAVNSVLNIGIPSKTLEKYLLKKVAKAWMRDANRKELVKAYEEIDAGPLLKDIRKQEEEDKAGKVADSMRRALKQKAEGFGKNVEGKGAEKPGRGGDKPSAAEQGSADNAN
jgi:hypothetical protein